VPSHAKRQPENSFILPKWTGDPADQTLIQLIPFLEYVATMGFEDTRKVLQSFEGTYIPAEFARREKLLRDKFAARNAEERKKRKPRRGSSSDSSSGGGGGGLFGSLFGASAGAGTAGADGADGPSALAEGEMLWDQIRRRGQKQYEFIDRQIREEGQKFLDDMAADEKKAQEESLNSVKGSVLGFFGGGGGGGGTISTPTTSTGKEEKK
jgi:mitochondrial import inner membrane translocase subunit TIM50